VTRRTSTPEAPLPVRLRPHQGESADSYLHRPAAANHLRFGYLRRYLATPRGSYGPIDAGGLAVLAGREPRAILRAFPELGRAALRQARTGRRYTREEIQHAYAAKQERYAVIRRDYINAMIDADPQIATATIWQRLADEHGTIVAYYTLRTHVISRREAVAREVNEETGLLVERIGPPGRSPGRGLAPHCSAGPASRAVIGPSSR
jgi:hypothetical protein